MKDRFWPHADMFAERVNLATRRPNGRVLQLDGQAPQYAARAAGVMLALRWNTLSGSYCALMRCSRSYLSP